MKWSDDQHLPTLRHSLREGGQMDPIPDQIVRGSAFAHPTPTPLAKSLTLPVLVVIVGWANRPDSR
ncbi:MAG: hypothetical protein F6K26_42105 [Moorea sp. SIO2I5]|nr:hypothetical protein [Moorena sp. SIO2I5]